jgi:hypothetical protein
MAHGTRVKGAPGVNLGQALAFGPENRRVDLKRKSRPGDFWTFLDLTFEKFVVMMDGT